MEKKFVYVQKKVCIKSICKNLSLENIEILQLIVDGEPMQLTCQQRVITELDCLIKVGDTAPRSCTCILDTKNLAFQLIWVWLGCGSVKLKTSIKP